MHKLNLVQFGNKHSLGPTRAFGNLSVGQKGPNYGNASNTFSYSTYFDDFPKLFLETTKFNTPINCLFTSASFTILGGSDTDAEESKNPSLSSTKSYNRSWELVTNVNRMLHLLLTLLPCSFSFVSYFSKLPFLENDQDP